MVESQGRAGHPLGARAGHPPTSFSVANLSSISGTSGESQLEHGRIVDERTAAAWCQHRHGDPYLPDEVRRARKGLDDLVERAKNRDDLSRDDRRLMRKYGRVLDEHAEATIAAFHACPVCSGTPSNEETDHA